MSFAKARRFDYSVKDVTPSPADYGSIADWTQISKCHQNMSLASLNNSNGSICSRKHTPCVKRRVASLNKLACDRTFKPDYSKTLPSKVKNLVQRFESLGSNKVKQKDDIDPDEGLDLHHGFIDDDYSSLASMTELHELKKTEEYEIKEIQKEIKRMSSNLLRDYGNPEETKIEVTSDSDCWLSSVEDVGSWEQLSTKGDTKNVPNLREVLTVAIEDLRMEFEGERVGVLREMEKRLEQFLRDMVDMHKQSEEKLSRVCLETIDCLVEEISALSLTEKSVICTDV